LTATTLFALNGETLKAIEDEFRSPPAEWLAIERRKSEGWSFKSENMAELLARPEPTLEWLIEDVWVDKSRGIIAGHPGVGKTWLALDMLLSVASGQLCLGKYQPKVVGPVLLVEEEASLLNLARRVHSMARGRGLKASELVNFHHVTRQFLKIPKAEKELIAFIKANHIKLVVFDSLRRLHNAKENSSDDMQPILESFARINTETECSLLLIHHLSKSGNEKGDKKPIFERMRGTSDLWAWRDCILGLEGEEEATRAICSFQFRDAESQIPIAITRRIDDLSGAISLVASDVEESEEVIEKAELILNYMRTQYGSVSKNHACDNVKGKRDIKLRAFKYLEKNKMVVAEGSEWVVPK
jgi:replicative DNA helicase